MARAHFIDFQFRFAKSWLMVFVSPKLDLIPISSSVPLAGETYPESHEDRLNQFKGF